MNRNTKELEFLSDLMVCTNPFLVNIVELVRCTLSDSSFCAITKIFKFPKVYNVDKTTNILIDALHHLEKLETVQSFCSILHFLPEFLENY